MSEPHHTPSWTTLPGPFHRHESGRWTSATEQDAPPELTGDALSVANLNVLFDHWRGQDYKPHIVHSERRFLAQFEIFDQLQPHVLCLNEVTPLYLEMLLRRPWLRDHWLLSEAQDDAPSLAPFGNLIVSRLPIEALYSIKLRKLKRRPICAILRLRPDHRIAICTAHLTARGTGASRRATQLRQLFEALDTLEQRHDLHQILLLGDLNLHHPHEDQNLRADYLDLWKSLRPDDPGFTFDARRNAMHREMWPLALNTRRMRLDRVLLHEHTRPRGQRPPRLTPRSIQIFADQPLDPNHSPNTRSLLNPLELTRRSVNQLSDLLLQRNLARDPNHYLYPSDHFGLLTHFSL